MLSLTCGCEADAKAMPAPPQISATYLFAEYEVLPDEGTLTRRGSRVRLQDQPFRLLVLLVTRPGALVTRQEIQIHLWPENTNVEFDKSLRVAMSKLREALRDPAETPIYIETVPRRGYRFIAPVTVREAPAVVSSPGLLTSGSSVSPAPSEEGALPATVPGLPALLRQPRQRVMRWLLAVAAFGLSAGIFVSRRFVHPVSPSTVVAHSEARLSVAVLGLQNLDGRPEDHWLSPALEEMLSSELAASERLRVISGEQVARAGLSENAVASPSNETLARYANQLGADLIVVGSYTVSPPQEKNGRSQLRIDLRIEKPASDESPVTLVETGLTSDIFALVSASGSELRQHLGMEEASAGTLSSVRRTLPTDPIAARLYAEGLQRLRVFDALHARDLLQKAARIEPTHAATHMALADAWHAIAYEREARAEAARAVELSAGLPREESLIMQADAADLSHDWQHAIDIFRTLATFYPDNIDYSLRLARTQVSSGKVPDALATFEQIHRQVHSPADSARLDLGEAYALLHHNDYPRALVVVDRAIKTGTDLNQNLVRAEGLWIKASCLERLGKSQESLDASSEAQTLYHASGDQRGQALALLMSGDVLYDHGKLEEARQKFLVALDIFRKIGFTVNAGVTQERIGNTYFDQGKLAESRDLYQQSLDAYREAHWQAGIPSAIGNIANVLDQEGDIEGALRLDAEGLAQFEQTGQQRGYGATLINMGNLEMERGALSTASRYYARAMEVDTKIAYSRGLADAMAGRGDIFMLRNETASAIAQYRQAIQKMQGADEPSVDGALHIALGRAMVLDGNAPQAVPLLQQGIDLALKGQDHGTATGGYAWLTRAWLLQGRIAEASTNASHAVEESHKQFAPLPQLDGALALARVQIAQGNPAPARDALLTSLQTAEHHGYAPVALEIRILLAQTDPSQAQRRRLLSALAQDATGHQWLMLANEARSTARQK
jgi:DNA-binding winged helix-turn-helix (wHTH) protein/tetratricopeptide (TPR) repeat protein/nucleotide-binding universal stress UspA family protein